MRYPYSTEQPHHNRRTQPEAPAPRIHIKLPETTHAPWIVAIPLTLLALFYLAVIAAAARGAYTGLLRGELFWRSRSGFAWHARGSAARFGGFVMLLIALGLAVAAVRAFFF